MQAQRPSLTDERYGAEASRRKQPVDQGRSTGWTLFMIEEFDAHTGYCRKLGHHLEFKYCRTVNSGKPCHLMPDCWFEKFPVAKFVEQHYTLEERAAFSRPPQPKIASLVDLIAKARQNQQ
jgi:hypothetical protein